MEIKRFKNRTLVMAEEGAFLKLKDREDSEELIGRPERIQFHNSGNIPEFEEIPMNLENIK